jgi:PAS domain S-box-containing protein
MLDIVLESIRAVVVAGILVFFVWFGRRGQVTSHRGWWAVVAGFGLVTLGSVVDITDNFESLNRYVFIGDTSAESFVEKVIGFLAGFVLLAVGFSLWLPRIGAVVASHDDIEGELEAAEIRFRSVFDHAPIAMVLCSMDGRFLQVNPAMCDLLKYSEEEFATLTWMDVTHPDDMDRSQQTNRTVTDGSIDSAAIEKRYLRSDGGVVIGQASITVVCNSGGTPLYLIAQVVDITEVSQAQQRLEELVRSKDQFLASVSHELRTPLTAVLGFAELLQQDATDIPPSARDEMVRSIADQAFDLNSIVEDLLVAARTEIGTLEVVAVPVSLAAQAAQVIETYEPGSVAHVGLTGEPGYAAGDPARVRQILRNLISNTLRYGGDDVQIVTRNGGSMAQVSVIDNGPGIPYAERDLIFEPYRRAHNEPGRPDSLGLGLAVSRQLAELMGGDLTYGYDDGQSTFTLSLPSAPSTSRLTSEPEGQIVSA